LLFLDCDIVSRVDADVNLLLYRSDFRKTFKSEHNGSLAKDVRLEPSSLLWFEYYV